MNNMKSQNILFILNALEVRISKSHVQHICDENNTNAKCNTTPSLTKAEENN
jgi:hypothetical protein